MPENNYTFTLTLKNDLDNITQDKQSIVKFYRLRPESVKIDKPFPRKLIGKCANEEVKITEAPPIIKFRVKHNKRYLKLRKVKFTETSNCKTDKKFYRFLWGPKRWKVTIEYEEKDINNPLAEAQTTVTATEKQ